MKEQQAVNIPCEKTRKEYTGCYAEIVRFGTDHDVLTVSPASDDLGGFKNDWFDNLK